MNAISRRKLLTAATTGASVAGLAVANIVATHALAAAVDPDAAIMDAFRRWVAAQHGLEAICADADDDAFSAACDAADAILMSIATMPAHGTVGHSVKAYALAHLMYGGQRGDYVAIGLPGDDENTGKSSLIMLRSMLEDAARCGITAEIAATA